MFIWMCCAATNWLQYESIGAGELLSRCKDYGSSATNGQEDKMLPFSYFLNFNLNARRIKCR